MYIEVKGADFSAVKVGIYDDFNYSENYFANAVTAEEAERQATHVYYYTGAVYSSIISFVGTRNKSEDNPDVMVSAVVPVIAGDTFIFSGENKNSFNGLPAITGYKAEQTISSNKATDILIWDENLSFENEIITITKEMVEAGVKYISACAIGNSDDLPTLKKRL